MDKNEAIEIWKDAPGYEGIYQISTVGRVKKLYREWNNGSRRSEETILNTHYGVHGYNHHVFIKNSIRKDFKVARLVAILFIPNPDNKPFVNHIDGVKSNDCVWNLEWATHKENDQHAYKIGLRCGMKGDKNGMATINSKTVLNIRADAEKKSYKQLAKKYDLNYGHIYLIVNRRIWKHI